MLRAKDGDRHLKTKYSRTATAAVAGATTTAWAVVGVTAGVSMAPATAEAGIQFKSYQTHSHVVVSVDPEVTYSVEPVQFKGKITGIRLILNNVKDELEDLNSSSDARTEKVMVTRTQTANGKQLIYQFLLSDRARSAGVEFFDYRNRAPGEIALDYWMHAGVPASASTPKSRVSHPRIARTEPKKRPAKLPDPVFGGCGQPLNPSLDGYAHFKVAHRPFAYREYINLKEADGNYNYPHPKPEKNENFGARAKEVSHYRLALKLYREGKYALTLRTMDFFNAQYPKSELVAELRFLRASTFVRLARLLKTERYMEQAMELYRQIILEEGNTERGHAALAFTVQEMMDKGTPINALEYTLIGAGEKPESYKNPKDAQMPAIYRLASAEALYALGEYDRSEKAYQQVIDLGSKLSPEAAFRIGETISARKFWERAVIAYEAAFRKFPNEASRYPTALFNLGEAYYRMEHYADAERVYRDYDKTHSNDELAWAARMRIADLEQMKIKAIEPKKHEAIALGFEAVVNRNPYSPAGVLAELRLARCYRDLPPGDRTREFFETLFNSHDLTKLEDPILESREVEQWMDLAEAEFFTDNGDPRRALKRADDYRLRLPKIPLGESFQKTYARAVVDLALALSKADSEKELLAVVEHYGDLAPRPEPANYVLAIAKAQLGVGKVETVAEKLALIENRIGELNDDGKDMYHLVKARSRRMLGENPSLVLAELGSMRDTGGLAAVKLDEMAQTLTDKHDYKEALAYDNRLLDSKELASKLLTKRRLEVEIRRIENLDSLGSSREAAKSSDQTLLRFGTETDYPQLLARLRDLRAQALFDSGDFKKAVEGFDEILGATPDHPRHSEFEFMRGKGLARLGRENEAYETFKKLAQAAGSDVWKKSAQAELDQLQWENKVGNLMKEKDRRSSQ